MHDVRVEVTPRLDGQAVDVRGNVVKARLLQDLDLNVERVRSICGFVVRSPLDATALGERVDDLFVDPIIEVGRLGSAWLSDETLFPETPDLVITVGFKPGVTDNAGSAALDGLRTLFSEARIEGVGVATDLTYAFYGLPAGADGAVIAASLHNPLIERALIQTGPGPNGWNQLGYPERPAVEAQPPAAVNLEVDDASLMRLSEEGLLALNLEEMQTIRDHYRDPQVQAARTALGLPPHAPTDVELECLAQTWSEHCKHKIFAARIHHRDEVTGEDTEIDSLFKTHIMRPTLDMQEEMPWLLSVFHDNSGVIAWDDAWSVCMKAETHNSPSALDPYGGAMTGIVGVNRDILGTGLGARPIANTDVFCFGPPNWEGDLPSNLFHPSRVLRGVHAGVRVGGNESGIPTVNGAIVFDNRYIGKPLVYCGTVGLMPATLPDGRPGHAKTAEPGDLVYMVGGRIGADGIHGATFSSLELTEDSPSSAVQIGDPITQKKMLDMLLEARDAGLIASITDNGAGGISSSIGEMAEQTGGVEIDLAAAPLKQVGLSPWEILVSESQERMTVAVHPHHAEAFEAMAAVHEVEATVVATFTDDGRFLVRHGEDVVALLPLEFLHDGVPQLRLESVWSPPDHPAFVPPEDADHNALLLRLLARPNVASKEDWVRQYDHEVIAQTAVKPFVGVERDGPADAAVIAPLHGSSRGLVISNGIVPRYADIDAGAMVVAAVDEAVRNAVCVGVDVDRMAGLDNFCWPDPIVSEKTPDGRFKLAQLVRANRELERMCRAYRVPCVSGKDSMKNDYGTGADKISIPPTMLFSLFGDHPDVRMTATSDLKREGERLYLFGRCRQELGASEVASMLSEAGEAAGIGGAVPAMDDPVAQREAYAALSAEIAAGRIRTAHDCSEGGLGVALAEMCIGGRRGAMIDLDGLGLDGADTFGQLWGESLGRIVIGVEALHEAEVCQALEQHGLTLIGLVVSGGRLVVEDGFDVLIDLEVEEMVEAWKAPLALPVGGGR